MAPVFDQRYDKTPKNTATPPRGPMVSTLKTALTTYNATTYTADRLNAMTYNDLVHAVTVHNLTVPGI